jgi:hypothetical protein
VLLLRDELRVGVEISITTDAEHEAENLRKCIAAGFTAVVCVSAEKKLRTYLAELATVEFPKANVHIVSPSTWLPHSTRSSRLTRKSRTSAGTRSR